MRIDAKLKQRPKDLTEKAQAVLATHEPNPEGVIGFPTLDEGVFVEWKAQTLTFLQNLLGTEHTYVVEFKTRVAEGHCSSVEAGMGILRAVSEDLELGLLTKVRDMVVAEVFSDFLEMAGHLLECGYKDPVASLVGAVLEDGLRKIATANGIKVKARDDLASLSAKCADRAVYNRLKQKQIQVWIGIRNHADHGEFGEYTNDDVTRMLAGVQEFLTEHI